MLHPDSVRLKPLWRTFDWCGADPATDAEVSPQSGKDWKQTAWGEERSLGLGLRLCKPAGRLGAASLEHGCARSDVQPRKRRPTLWGRAAQASSYSNAQGSFPTAMPSDLSPVGTVIGLRRAFVWFGKR